VALLGAVSPYIYTVQHQEETPPAKLHKHNSEQPRTISIVHKNQSTPLSQDR
jgi:hypothetical protein